MQIRTVMKKSSFLILVLLGMVFGCVSYAAIKDIPPQDKLDKTEKFPKNESGETYGSIRDLSPYEEGPDLIKAYTVDGKIGYVRAKDFFEEPPKTPEEALKRQADKSVKEINVYESDGKTVIGKFEMKPAITSYDGKKPEKEK